MMYQTELLLLLGTTLVISISGVVMPGPVFAAAVAGGHKGRYSGALVAFGHAVIEFPTIFLVALGVRRLLSGPGAQIAIGLFGGVMLMVMAREMFKLDSSRLGETGNDGVKLLSGERPLLSGILTTMANPYFFLWWATIGAALVLAALRFGMLALIIFAVMHWSVDLIWLSFVGYTVNRTKELWSERTYKAVFWGCGSLLVLFGVWFIASAALLLA